MIINLLLFVLICMLIYIIFLISIKKENNENYENKEENILDNFISIEKLKTMEFKTGKSDKEYQYRLSDMFKSKIQRHWVYPMDKKKETIKQKHLKYHPNTIASLYMEQTDDESNYDILIDVIKKYKPIDGLKYDENFYEDNIIIHLRVGDWLRDIDINKNIEKYESNTYLKKRKLKGIKYFEKEIEKIEKIPTRNIIFVFGFHQLHYTEKSREYMFKIGEHFENKGYNVRFKSGDPDDDFVFMVNSKYYIPTSGGYSKLVETLQMKINSKENN